MILHFHEPPPAQRLGGLDAAIRGLQDALARLGHTVDVNPKSGTPDIAHFHGLWQPGYPSIAKAYRAASVPYVVSPHGMLEPWAWRHKWWKKFPYWHLVEKRWIRGARSVLATGGPEAVRLANFVPQACVKALPLGLTGGARADYATARARLGWAEDETVLLFLSRIHEKKGLDILLGALAGMKPPANTRLVIVGPDEQPSYAARCRTFGEANASNLPRVEWRGAAWGDERWPYLQGADLLCLPTHSENFGLVILEACQVGTPVLTTEFTPWASALAGRGYIGKPDRDSTRESLRRFFATPRLNMEQRAQLSEWAWANFHWDILAPKYVDAYRQAIGN